MRLPHVTLKLLLALAMVACVSSFAHAASLYGTVTEINDGDTITIVCLKRPLKVKLMAIDAPEKNQAYADIAKQHLADLILNKFVSVEYSGLGHNGLIIGKVFINEIDVAAQMVRDGVAWYDKETGSRLSEAERQMYVQSEEAARSEKRGLWQDEAPIAPWDFVRTLTTRASHLTPSNSEPGKVRMQRELTSESLLGSGLRGDGLRDSSASTSGKPRAAAGIGWQILQPPRENFTALVPVDGRELSNTVPFAGGSIEVNYFTAKDSTGSYILMWSTIPSQGETDAAAMNGALLGMINAIGEGYESVGGKFSCRPSSDSNISLNGYVGREYNLRSCTIPAMARVYSKVVKGQRQMYVGAAFFVRSDANAMKFLQSFTISNNSNPEQAAGNKSGQ